MINFSHDIEPYIKTDSQIKLNISLFVKNLTENKEKYNRSMDNDGVLSYEIDADELDAVELDTPGIKSVSEILVDIEDHYKTMTQNLSEVKKITRDLEKSHQRPVRTARKSIKKTSSNNDKKNLSGFQKPVPVEFTKHPWCCTADQKLSRSDLTKMVYKYIKENKLQDEQDKRVICPDATLIELFHIEEGDKLEFRNFQTYMTRLYIQTECIICLYKFSDNNKNKCKEVKCRSNNYICSNCITKINICPICRTPF